MDPPAVVEVEEAGEVGNSMELDIDNLKSTELIVVCPSCHKPTVTGYSLFDQQLRVENPGAMPLEFKCEHCGQPASYDPTTKESFAR